MLLLNVTSTGNAASKNFKMVFQMLLLHLDRWIVYKPLSVNIFLTLTTQ
jgi:hypothetical protein